MSTKPNYFKIGLFVLFAVIIVLAAVVVFGAGLLTQNRIYFETYFTESVSGLIEGSPVELRGVLIGKVRSIGFVSEKYEIPNDTDERIDLGRSVRVIFFVNQSRFSGHDHTEETMQLWKERIRDGLRMQLVSNVLTGQTYLEGSYLDPKRYPIPTLAWTPEYTFIPSAPSQITTIKDSLDKILQRLQELDIEKLVQVVEKVFVSLDKAIEGAKIDQLSATARKTLDSIDQAVTDANVPQISSQVELLLAEARQTNERLKSLLEDKNVSDRTNNVPELIARLNNLLMRIDNLLSQQTPQIEEVLEDLRKVSSNLKDITDILKVDPSLIMFGQPPPKSEVVK